MTGARGTHKELPVDQARGTRDFLPGEFTRIRALEHRLLSRFEQAGYQPIRTPILELTELHSRKSGAGIVSRLFELGGDGASGLCLRPELTAGIVRAYVAAAGELPLPWRVCSSGPVFRYESDLGGDRLREFTQVGVEQIGLPGPAGDAEVIGLACRTLAELKLPCTGPRIGHVGVILDLLAETGLPRTAAGSLVEMLSAAAADGHGVQSLDLALERLTAWLRSGVEAEEVVPAVEQADDQGVDRLFRQLVPRVVGRRSGPEIIHRLRDKWRLDHTLSDALADLRERIEAIAALKGPAPGVLKKLKNQWTSSTPEAIETLTELVDQLGQQGVAAEHIELDLGFSRGIGFYSQTIFAITIETPSGPIEVCGGGRYDGLASVLGSIRNDPGAGFAFGLERLAEACRQRGVEP